MGFSIGKIHFCSDGDSPEILLAFIVPLVTLSVLLANNYSYIDSIFISLLSGLIVYIFITLVKNIIAIILKSDLSCKIPRLDELNFNQ